MVKSQGLICPLTDGLKVFMEVDLQKLLKLEKGGGEKFFGLDATT